MDPDYVYSGDRNTAPSLKGKFCSAVRVNGKCVRGRNGNMLVRFEDGRYQVVMARHLRIAQRLKRHERHDSF